MLDTTLDTASCTIESRSSDTGCIDLPVVSPSVVMVSNPAGMMLDTTLDMASCTIESYSSDTGCIDLPVVSPSVVMVSNPAGMMLDTTLDTATCTIESLSSDTCCIDLPVVSPSVVIVSNPAGMMLDTTLDTASCTIESRSSDTGCIDSSSISSVVLISFLWNQKNNVIILKQKQTLQGYMSCCMTKPTKWPVRRAKTQISLGIRPVWSESSLSAWKNTGPLTTYWADSEDSDQIGRMPRPIWVFVEHTCQFVGFVVQRLIW